MCQYTVLFIFLINYLTNWAPYVELTFFLADEADGALPEELEANRSHEDGADLGEEQEQQFHHLEETAEPLPESSQPPRQPRSSAYSGTHVSMSQRCFSSSVPPGPSVSGSIIIFHKRGSGQGQQNLYELVLKIPDTYILNTECKKHIIFRRKSMHHVHNCSAFYGLC